MRTVAVWSYFVVLSLFVSPFAVLVFWIIRPLVGPKRADHFAHEMLRLLSRTVIKAIGCTIEVTGAEHVPDHDRIVIVSNHQEILDTLLLTVAFPRNMGAIGDVFLAYIPIMNLWLRPLRYITIHRNKLSSGKKAIDRAISQVRSGYPVFVSPEGKLSKGPEVGPFKPGSLRIALRSGGMVVPVTMNGTYLAINQGKLHPARLTVHIHPPVDPAAFETTRELADHLREVIASGIPNDATTGLN